MLLSQGSSKGNTFEAQNRPREKHFPDDYVDFDMTFMYWSKCNPIHKEYLERLEGKNELLHCVFQFVVPYSSCNGKFVVNEHLMITEWQQRQQSQLRW